MHTISRRRCSAVVTALLLSAPLMSPAGAMADELPPAPVVPGSEHTVIGPRPLSNPAVPAPVVSETPSAAQAPATRTTKVVTKKATTKKAAKRAAKKKATKRVTVTTTRRAPVKTSRAKTTVKKARTASTTKSAKRTVRR